MKFSFKKENHVFFSRYLDFYVFVEIINFKTCDVIIDITTHSKFF